MSSRFVAKFPLGGAGMDADEDLPRPGFSLLEPMASGRGFVPDVRFGGGGAGLPVPVEVAEVCEPEPEVDRGDPVAEAFEQGFAQGYDKARAEALAAAEADVAAREGLALSFGRLDAVLEEELRLRLRDAVVALCEAAIAPLALDEEALLRRVAVAASMLARADDQRVIRLNPQDLKLLADRLYSDWNVQPDATLERGTVRIESTSGGVEDGPVTWRHAIAEALHQC